MGRLASRAVWFVAAALLAPGCGFGPRTLHQTRLPYNEAIKTTSEEQLLLNIVRLRYSDNPSSLAVSNIAAQFEMAKKLQLVPFFTSAAAGQALGGYRGAVLPGAELNAADRPTLSLTPQDESEFARRLFTPLPLKGIVYLATTTWPISTVFRLYLENLNWVPNAQTLSGPTPPEGPPEEGFEPFLRGVAALRRLQRDNRMAILLQEEDERVGGTLPAKTVTARDLIEAAKAGHEFKVTDGAKEWELTKKKDTPYLFIAPDAVASPDWAEFCQVFKVKPGEKKYEIEVTKLTPFPVEYPAEGVKVIDLETRSLLQVLYFVAHGVEVPSAHITAGLVRMTLAPDGSVFDYDRVLGGLFQVKSDCGKCRPKNAAVAVHYCGHWFYIDESDHDTRATFALLLHMSRLETSGGPAGSAPVLTLPLGSR